MVMPFRIRIDKMDGAIRHHIGAERQPMAQISRAFQPETGSVFARQTQVEQPVRSSETCRGWLVAGTRMTTTVSVPSTSPSSMGLTSIFPKAEPLGILTTPLKASVQDTG